MPIYEYQCEGGHKFTARTSIADRHKTVCPMCKHYVRLNVSLSNFRMAVPFTVVSPEHGIVHQRPDGGRIRPTMPYKDIPREV